MSHRIRLVRLALAAALAGLALPAVAPAAEVDEPAASPALPDRAIVVWEDGASRVQRAEARADADAAFVRTLGDPRFQLVQPEPGQSLGELLGALRADPAVQAASRDGYSRVSATTNDPFFDLLWGLLNSGLGVNGFSGAVAGLDIDVQAAWDRTRGTPSTIVAIIDSGYRFDHPDLAGVAWTNDDPPNGVDDDGNGYRDDLHGVDFVGRDLDVPQVDADPTDDDAVDGGHGPHVAGTAAAAGNNGIGITGVAQDARVMPLRVCGFSMSRGSGGWCSDSAQIAAINYAGRNGARVANMSLGGSGFNSSVQAALAANSQVLFVIAAGNGGADSVGDDNDVRPQYPCAYPLANVVCVAATNQADQLARFSNFGSVSVDLGAPGTETYSAYPDYAELASPLLTEGFQGGDFATRWARSGAGMVAASESPLTSTGLTDTSGAGAPAAGQTHQVELSAGLTIPAGVNACRLAGSRFVRAGGGSANYYILTTSTSWSFTPSNTAGSAMVAFSSSPVPVTPGETLRLRFRYIASGSPAVGDGVWWDDLAVHCSTPLSAPPRYGFLQGTSMATPHVSGAAALLYSLKPTATVAEVRSALLSSVDAVPALAGKSVTGGRLNVARALDTLVPPSPPAPPAPPVPPVVNPPLVNPPVARPAAVRCVVPRLARLSLARARAALVRAHCRLGRVTRPRARRGRRLPPLVVRSSRPGTGTTLAENASVAVTLKVKPPRRARRRGR